MDEDAKLYLMGNSPKLIEALKGYLVQSKLKILTQKPKKFDYQVYVLDLAEDIPNQTKEVLDELSTLQGSKTKLAVVAIGSIFSSKRNLEYFQQVLQPLLSDKNRNIRLIQTLDVYHRNTSEPLTIFEKEVAITLKSKKIAVSFNGARVLYLTDLEDLALAITKSLFISNTSGATFTVISELLTDLEYAYLLKKHLEKYNLNLEIDLNRTFKQNHEDYQELSVRTQAQLNWLPKTSISDAVDYLIKSYSTLPEESKPKAESKPLLRPLQKPKVEKIMPPTPPAEKLHRTEERGLLKIIAIVGALILAFIIIPTILAVLGFYLSSKETYQAFQALRRGDTKTSVQQLNLAEKITSLTESAFKYAIIPGNLLVPKVVTDANNYLLLVAHGQTILDSAIKTYTLTNHLYQSILGQEPLGSDQTVEAIKVNLISLNANLSEIQLLLNQTQLPGNLQKYLGNTNLNHELNLLKNQISTSLPLLDIVNQIITNKAVQHYVVLVQDNNELRASGGFITSLITVTLDQGQVIDIQAEPSLGVDRLVEGSIPPPAPVKQLLNQANWTFRDSNVDADFSVAGKQVAWFLERFKTVKVDGLIGLNLSFYKSFLAEYGPLTLANGQVIDLDNLNTLASNPTADTGLDLITQLSKTLTSRLLNKQITLIPFARAGLKQIATNELSLYFPNQQLEDLAVKSNLSGGTQPLACHPQLGANCQSDTVYLNESNFSVAKTNYYLKRLQKHQLEIDPAGNINISLTYNYSFPVPVPNSITQPYKVFYQLYLPAGFTNLTVSLDNQNLDQGSLVTFSTSGQTKISFSGLLALNQNHLLKINFTSPSHLNLKSSQIAYSLSFLKQPGTGSDKFTYSLHYPDTLNPKVLTVPMQGSSSKELSYQTDTSANISFGVLFNNTAL